MRKVITLVLFLFAFVFVSNAQDMSPNAIGLKFGQRTGEFSGSGVTISYQKALGQKNRLELDLGIFSGNNHSYFNLAGFYQWVHNIDGGWNWYLGPGASIGSGRVKHDHGENKSRMYFGIAGQIGIEYRFKIPLHLTLDANPYLGLINSEGFSIPLQLGVRYLF